MEEREPGAAAASSNATAATQAEPDLSGAMKAALPQKLEPQLATLTSTPPTGPGWLIDPKYDGYRIMAIQPKPWSPRRR